MTMSKPLVALLLGLILASGAAAQVSTDPGLVTFDPASPTTCDSLGITYNCSNRVLNNATQMSVMLSFNNFLTTSVVPMSAVSPNVWTVTNAIPATATNAVMDFIANSDPAKIDSSNATHFIVAVAACTNEVNPVTFSPTVVTPCSGLTISYSAVTGTLLFGATQIQAYIRFDNSSSQLVASMSLVSTTPTWRVQAPVPEGSANAQVSFDNNGTTNLVVDNNSSNFYIAAISVCSNPDTNGFVFSVRGDIDGDGLGDLVIRREDSETYALAFMDGLDAIETVDFLGAATDISPFH